MKNKRTGFLRLNIGYFERYLAIFLFVLTAFSTVILIRTHDTTTAILDTAITSGESTGCEFTGTTISAHSATITLGASESDFGSTKITTICPNSIDHQVYAVGYTGEVEGNTNLVDTVTSETIATGTESGNISNWSMKIAKDTSSYLSSNLSIENNFDSAHVVPGEATLISSYTGGTDTTTGSSIMTTYSARSSNTQIAGKYAGQVKYILTATMTYNVTIKTTEGIDKVTLNGVECTSTEGCIVTGLISNQSYTLEVTPTSGYEFTGWNTITSGAIADSTVTSTTYTIGEADETLEPEAEKLVALLDTGINVNEKMKTLANGTYKSHNYSDFKIKSFQRSNTLPEGFIASSSNIISSNSRIPIYIFFDNTNNAGIMYYYARNDAVVVANADLSRLFKRMTALREVPGLADWDTSNVVDMNDLFYQSSSLIDISGVSNWDTANVLLMGDLFAEASSLIDISGVSNWDTAKVTSMSNMFNGTKITNVDALATGKNGNPNIWNTSNVIYMNNLFNNATALENISGLANWDTSSVIDMNHIFYLCSKITNLDALATGKNGNPNIWNTSNVTNMSYMFYRLNLVTDISGLANWDTSSVTDMNNMFESVKFTNLDALVTGKNGNPNIWNTGNVTNMKSMFLYTSSLTDISGLSNWDTSKVTDMSQMFYCSGITNTNALATGKNNNPNIWNTSNVENMKNMFNSTSLTDISGLSDWDTSKVTDMSAMFYGTRISNVNALATGKNNNPNIWNTGNVTDMNNMFCGTQQLTDISGLSDWDTSEVTNMSEMFRYSRITNLDALTPNKNNNQNIWNTSNVTNMTGMFQNDTHLTNISGITDWDVSSVIVTAGGTTSATNHFYMLFKGVPGGSFVFANRPGTINSDGTYIPST